MVIMPMTINGRVTIYGLLNEVASCGELTKRKKNMALQIHALLTNLGFEVHGTYSKDLGEMFRITTENKRGKIILSVEGRLAGAGVRTLEQCWRELAAVSPRPKFHINLCGVSFIDNTGKVLLKEMHQQGAALIAEGCLNQAIVREIIGAKGRNSEGEGSEGSRKPSNIIFYVLFSSGFFTHRARYERKRRTTCLPHRTHQRQQPMPCASLWNRPLRWR